MATTVDCLEYEMEETPISELSTGAGTTPGTGSAPYRTSSIARYSPIQQAKVEAGPSYLSRADEQRGIEGVVPDLIDGYAPSGSINVRAYLNDLVFLLNTAGLTDTITAGNGTTTKDPDNVVIPVGATKHVFTKRSGVQAQTMAMTLAYVNAAPGSNPVYVRGNGFGVTNVGLSSDGAFTTTLAGLYFKRLTSDPNISPAFDSPSILMIRRGDMKLTWLGASGDADITAFNLSIVNNLVPRMTGQVASYFPDKMEQGDTRVALTGTIPMVTLTAADIDASTAATTFAATAKWITPTNIAATSYKYSIWVEMPSCQYTGQTLDPIANSRRFGGQFPFRAAWDITAGYDFRITIVNSITGPLATYI